MFARKKKKIWPVVLTAVLLLTVLLGAAAGYAAGTLELTLELNGERSLRQEYGGSITDPGAKATLTTTLTDRFSWEIPVTVTGSVEPGTVGAYSMAYRARFLWLDAMALRTVQIVDTAPPVITLVDDPDDFTLPGQSYIEVGYTAYDAYDGDLTGQVQWSLTGNIMTYWVSDSSGNTAIAQRTIDFTDPVPPELTLEGEQELTLYLGREYEEPGYTAWDNLDGNITDRVVAEGLVDPNTPGTYTITYSVTDTFGNPATQIRTVTVGPAPQLETVEPEGKVIYLTFDDGPGPYTEKLLQTLKKYGVKATFFVVDTKYIDLVSDIVEDGHSIGVHTASHVYGEIYASEEAFFADFKTVHDRIREKTGVSTTLMRFPGGSSNRVSSFNPGIMTRLTGLVTDYGLQYFDWNVNSMDAGGANTAEQVYRNVISGVRGNRYSVVLQHDIHSFSVEAVEKIIKWGLANGYTFLPLEPDSPGCHQTVVN